MADTVKSFKSKSEVRWCPGCGDHAIINAMQKAMSNLGIENKDYAVVSGIGCSSRLPYYMSTYGFHTIHGRAAAVASGVKSANPDLCVWEITGDGDALAIGGNHFIHMIRRNIDINVVLFNNKVYGLTKGQYSPTSDRGFVTKSSPYGTIEEPFVPGQLVLGAKGTFFARSIDNNIKLCQEIFEEMARFKGTAVTEVLQNCVIYNNGAYHDVSGAELKKERQIVLRHGEPMLFGKENDKGLIFDNGKLKAVSIGENGISKKDILIHNAKEESGIIHQLLIGMQLPELPIAMGVIRAIESPTYDQCMHAQIKEIQGSAKIRSVDELFQSGNTWVVK